MIEDVNKRIQPSYDTNRQVLGKILPLDTPFTVILDTSEACNFKCKYCFRSHHDKRDWGYAASGGLMPWSIFEKAADQLLRFPQTVRQVSLSNHGEPLANRDICQMAKYLREKGFDGRISIHTNASLLDEEYAGEVGTCGMSRIIVSLQGLTGERYEKICGARIDENDFFENLSVMYAASRENKHKTEIHIKIANAALDGSEEQVFYERFEKIADRVFVEHIVPIWKNGNADGGEKAVNKYGASFPGQKCCRLIFDTLVVAPNGDVYPCTQLVGTPCIGNIQEIPLFEIWNNQKRIGLLEKILCLDEPDMCKECYIKQNSVYTKEDMIDGFREEILRRLEEKGCVR